MKNTESSYKQIIKATSIFGGVQFVNILVQIIRSKAIALLIGPSGMGIFGLLTSTVALIAGFTNFGLSTSAVKELSSAVSSKDEKKLSLIISIFRKLVLVTGLVGVVVTLIFSPFLSNLIFDNHDNILSFVFLSITLLFMQLTAGQNVLMQGLRKLNLLAKANVYAAIFSLILTMPFYYFYGMKGIVPAMIIASIISFITEFYFASKIKIKSVKVSLKVAIVEGKEMLKMGFMISLSGLVALGASYLIRIYITRFGSIEDVGMYTAGFAIINNYVGLIFTAMATDYYPKLASISNSKDVSQLVNQQSEIAILILAPLLCIFLVFIKVLVVLLYSDQFLPVEGMLRYAILGIFFKAIGWALGFVLLTKGSGKLYFINELIANCYMLILNIFSYNLWGLDGLGISFVVGFFIYFLQVFFICTQKFYFGYLVGFYKIFLIQLLLALLCFACVKNLSGYLLYVLGIFIIILSITYSLVQINKLVNLHSIINKIRYKN